MTALTLIWKLFTEVDAILSSIIAPELLRAFAKNFKLTRRVLLTHVADYDIRKTPHLSRKDICEMCYGRQRIFNYRTECPQWHL